MDNQLYKKALREAKDNLIKDIEVQPDYKSIMSAIRRFRIKYQHSYLSMPFDKTSKLHEVPIKVRTYNVVILILMRLGKRDDFEKEGETLEFVSRVVSRELLLSIRNGGRATVEDMQYILSCVGLSLRERG